MYQMVLCKGCGLDWDAQFVENGKCEDCREKGSSMQVTIYDLINCVNGILENQVYHPNRARPEGMSDNLYERLEWLEAETKRTKDALQFIEQYKSQK